MVKVLVSLKWQYFKAGFRKNPWALVGFIFGCLYMAGVLVGFGLLATVASETPEGVLTFLVFFGAVLTLLWWIIPIVASGADATLDPDRLAPYPLTTAQLQKGQFLGAFIGLPGFATILCLLLALLVFLQQPLALVAYLVACIFAGVLIVSGSRLITLASIRLRSNRKTNQIITSLAFLVLICLGPIFMGITTSVMRLFDQLPMIARFVSFTPLGAPFAVPGYLATGEYLPAGICGLLTLGYAACAWWLWHKTLGHTMHNIGAYTGTVASSAVARGKLGLLGRFPATPRGAIAARTVLTLLKDNRASLYLIMVPAMYVIASLTAWGTDGERTSNPIFLLLVPAMAGYVFAYLVSYDNSAFSLHVLAPLRGIDDRLGRAYGLLIVMLPIIVIGTCLHMVFIGNPSHLPIVLSLSIMLLLNGIGMGAYLDMVLSIPTPPPGTSPWKAQRNPDGFAKGLAQTGYMLLLFASAIPSTGFWIAYSLTGNALWNWFGTIISLVIGGLCFFFGIKVGAARYDKHAADALQRVSRKG